MAGGGRSLINSIHTYNLNLDLSVSSTPLMPMTECLVVPTSDLPITVNDNSPDNFNTVQPHICQQDQQVFYNPSSWIVLSSNRPGYWNDQNASNLQHRDGFKLANDLVYSKPQPTAFSSFILFLHQYELHIVLLNFDFIILMPSLGIPLTSVNFLLSIFRPKYR